MKEFILAALPFVIIGLCVAVIVKNCKTSKEEKTYITEGMCLGMCFGSLIGSFFIKHIGIFLSLGMLIGETIGCSIKKKDKKE